MPLLGAFCLLILVGHFQENTVVPDFQENIATNLFNYVQRGQIEQSNGSHSKLPYGAFFPEEQKWRH